MIMESGYGPLNGIRVIDFTHVMAGPTCSLMLADMGADVIKIERVPFEEDPSHNADDPYWINGVSASYMIVNRNKRGLPLDLKRKEAVDIARRLIASADIIVENFRPGVPMTDITAGILLAMGLCAALRHRDATGEGQMVDTSLFEAGIVQTYWHSAIAFATGEAPPTPGVRTPPCCALPGHSHKGRPYHGQCRWLDVAEVLRTCGSHPREGPAIRHQRQAHGQCCGTRERT